MSNCIFCKIIQKQLQSHIVWEDEHTIAFLDIKPVSRGHMLVCPKEHVSHLGETTIETANAIITTCYNLITKLNLTDYNLLSNSGKIAGQEVPHLHIHIIPKFEDSGLNLKGTFKQMKVDLNEVHGDILKKLRSNYD